MRAFKNSKMDSAVSVTPLSFDSAVSMTLMNHGARSYPKIIFIDSAVSMTPPSFDSAVSMTPLRHNSAVPLTH